ncbi:NUDIX hydrolase [Guptibacillus algicola]|uniref:NUDIX hydrolase n=1 Tax=Guptibacillus algicola TaxID=225844 RepID=UPI001CD4AB85|nr:NUDIX domain-containing protein [Alkalihalobacillus algicola]MCA0987158.1 NUDIX domain-containing protein [Alkalihalobacillus algicola]
MDQEKLNIYDEHRNHIGVASRKEVHEKGYWHEAFHCWFVSLEKEKISIYLQLRSKGKKDYPDLLDITAAGHILANETVQDGVREVKEELGADVAYEELEQLGVLNYCVERGSFIDKEIANVFLYQTSIEMKDFTFQKEEVAGMVKADFQDFTSLWKGDVDSIMIQGFKIDEDGAQVDCREAVGRDKFVPHEKSFYLEVIERIKQKLGL